MVIENKFEIGQIVFIKTDQDQHARMITQIAVGGKASIRYCIGFGATETWHYDIELSEEKNVLIQ